MRLKIRTISLTALILCILIIITKAFMEVFIQSVVLINLVELVYVKSTDVTNYLYENYITLMKVDTIGLTIGVLTAAVLIGVAFYLKLTRILKNSKKYKTFFITSFSIINGLAVITTMLTLFSGEKIFYTILQYLMLAILLMILFDTIYTFIRFPKSFTKFMKTTTTTAAVVLLGLGLFIHFKDINRYIDTNNEIIEYQLEYATEYYNNLYDDEDYVEIMIKQHMYLYEELHTNKGLLIGVNSMVNIGYDHIVKNNNNISASDRLNEEELALYGKLAEPMTLNIPLFSALAAALCSIFFSSLVENKYQEKKEEEIIEILKQLEDKEIELKNNKISQEDYDHYKTFLFEKYKNN